LDRDRPHQFERPPARGAVASLLLRIDGRAAALLHEQIYTGIRGRILSGAPAKPGPR
jgi:hypothetical protein